ncbi:MAG: FAD-dependent oxidoreductase, partial [Clostridia bacterium]|nr:FAD-dependent oxidoreductase [Clostridia bacterium]
MREIIHNAEFCVIGGGLSGLCAAIAAARHGAKTVLMHDRPVLGGNASSEIRMCICGARGENNKETGIIEELQLENLYLNPNLNYSLWDSVLYGKAMSEENLTVLLNCSCIEAQTEGKTIKSVKGWQGTAETYHIINAKNFADCSGDSILAPLTGADFRMGREAHSEYGEALAHEEADNKTMGMSCIMQLRDTGKPQKFTPPKWANKYPTEK